MPIPLILAGAVGLYGVYKGVSGAIDHTKADDVNSDAKSMVDSANQKVEVQRKSTNAVLEDYGSRKLRAFNGAISDFIDTFGRLKNVESIKTPELDNLNISDFSTVSLTSMREDYQLLKDSGLGLGAGVGSGAALAFGAYNGTMLLATASTGTAISTLSGVAATNATLAWLGGGTIAAGGGGMAMGAMVLGGIVAGPALAIFGHIVGNKGEEALNNAYSNFQQARTISDRATLMCSQLAAIQDVTGLANGTFSKITGLLRQSVGGLKTVIDTNGDDYQKFSSECRESVFRAVKFAQLLKAMIDTPILDKDGNLVLATKERVQEMENAASGQQIN
jgi:hypothetical protein